MATLLFITLNSNESSSPPSLMMLHVHEELLSVVVPNPGHALHEPADIASVLVHLWPTDIQHYMVKI